MYLCIAFSFFFSCLNHIFNEIKQIKDLGLHPSPNPGPFAPVTAAVRRCPIGLQGKLILFPVSVPPGNPLSAVGSVEETDVSFPVAVFKTTQRYLSFSYHRWQHKVTGTEASVASLVSCIMGSGDRVHDGSGGLDLSFSGFHIQSHLALPISGLPAPRLYSFDLSV